MGEHGRKVRGGGVSVSKLWKEIRIYRKVKRDVA